MLDPEEGKTVDAIAATIDGKSRRPPFLLAERTNSRCFFLLVTATYEKRNADHLNAMKKVRRPPLLFDARKGADLLFVFFSLDRDEDQSSRAREEGSRSQVTSVASRLVCEDAS